MNQNKVIVSSFAFWILILFCFIEKNTILSLPLIDAKGNWAILGVPEHPDFNGYILQIKYNQQEDSYNIGAHIINSFGCSVQFDPAIDEWKSSKCATTEMYILDDKQRTMENDLFKFIQNIQKIIRNDKILYIIANNGDRINLVREA
ncbi:unnamed protein product [Adineta steineri]|uniref:Uncharacterized protein n=1 Tax=Adineta steineri TaxID=433720 RepID=A0A815SLU3_9BILA|nr:unnamed protein product [Adineta steineri]CAF1493199.1 unnamed protein product [Adineta steineri]